VASEGLFPRPPCNPRPAGPKSRHESRAVRQLRRASPRPMKTSPGRPPRRRSPPSTLKRALRRYFAWPPTLCPAPASGPKGATRGSPVRASASPPPRPTGFYTTANTVRDKRHHPVEPFGARERGPRPPLVKSVPLGPPPVPVKRRSEKGKCGARGQAPLEAESRAEAHCRLREPAQKLLKPRCFLGPPPVGPGVVKERRFTGGPE